MNSRIGESIQHHHPSIGYPSPIIEQQKRNKKINKIESGTICSTICGSKLPISSETNGKYPVIEPVFTLHRDQYSPSKDVDTSINYKPSLVPASQTDMKRNIEPELRFYPSEGTIKDQDELNK